MASENAKAVAQDVIETVGKGGKVNKTKIHLKHGYSKTSAKSHKATETETYKAEIKPFLQQLESHRQAIIAALSSKDLSKERFRDLTDALAKATHDIQLLSGGKTSNDKVTFIWADAPSSNPIQPEALGKASS